MVISGTSMRPEGVPSPGLLLQFGEQLRQSLGDKILEAPLTTILGSRVKPVGICNPFARVHASQSKFN